MPIERGELKRIVSDTVAEVLDHRQQLRKNGETWPGYLRRLITPERLALVALLIFNTGGGWRDAQAALKASTEQARVASDQATAASRKADEASRKADDAAQAMEGARQELSGIVADLQHANAQNAELRDRIGLSVTRAEFSSAIAQQVLPRLERIEQQLWENRR